MPWLHVVTFSDVDGGGGGTVVEDSAPAEATSDTVEDRVNSFINEQGGPSSGGDLSEGEPVSDSEPAEEEGGSSEYDDLFSSGSDEDEQEQEPKVEAPAFDVSTIEQKMRDALPLALHKAIIDDVLMPSLNEAAAGLGVPEQLQPFTKFVENGMTVETLEASLGVLQYMREDPGGALKELANHARSVGLSVEELLGIPDAQTPSDSEEGVSGADDSDEYDLFGKGDVKSDPAFQALQKQLEEQQKVIDEFRKSREETSVREERAQIDSEVSSLEAAFEKRGELFNRERVVQLAAEFVRSQPDDADIDFQVALREGARRWRSERDQILRHSQKRAPRLGGRGGSVEPPAQDEEKGLSFAEKIQLRISKLPKGTGEIPS